MGGGIGLGVAGGCGVGNVVVMMRTCRRGVWGFIGVRRGRFKVIPRIVLLPLKDTCDMGGEGRDFSGVGGEGCGQIVGRAIHTSACFRNEIAGASSQHPEGWTTNGYRCYPIGSHPRRVESAGGGGVEGRI